MDVDKLIVQPSLSEHQHQNLRLLRLCAQCVKMRDDLVATWEQNQMVFGKQFKDMNRIYGMPTEFECKIFPGITTLDLLEKIQSLMRPTVWTWAFQRQDHLHVNSQRHWMGIKRKQRKMWIQFTDSCELSSQIPSRSLVFLGAWIRREMVRNLHWQTRRIMESICREYDGKLLSIWSSDISCLQCFWERRSKEGDISRYMKPSSCFSAQWFLRISSVSTEQ